MSTTSAQSRPRSGRGGRIALFGLAALIAVLVGVIWILPGMLDWNRYRGSIAALVAAGIGRPVEIDGNITLHLLPQPILTASSLKVDDPADGVVMAVHEARLRVALGPLLGGRVDARELTLRGADLRLPWPPPAGALSRRPPAWLTGLQARVEESRLQVGGLVLSDIDASLGSNPDTGTISAAGSGKLFGLNWRFTARLGQPGPDGAAPLDVSLDGEGRLRDTGGTFSGALADDGGLSGRVAARGPDLSQLIPAPAVAWRGDGRLSAASGLAVADELALEIGGSPAQGAVALRVQPNLRLDLALTAGRLDLDAWAPVLLRAAQAATPAIPTGIDLSAEAATLAGGTLRKLRGAFDIDVSGVTMRELTAVLPGEAKLSMQGRFPRARPGALFEGSVGLVAPDLRGTLRWLEPFAPALLHPLPAEALQNANLTAKLAIDPEQLSLTDMKGMLDGAAAEGGLALRLGKRPAISAGLSLDRLLLDPWLPRPATIETPEAAYAALTKMVAGAEFDADVKLQLRHAAWRGTEFGPVSIDAQNEASRLTVRRLEATAMGIHATASGTLGEGGRVYEGRLELQTQDVAPIRALLPDSFLTTAEVFRGPASALVLASGPPNALAVGATLQMNDLRAEVQPIIDFKARRWSGPIMLHHPGASRLLARLGVPGAASWFGDGSFSVIAQAKRAPGRLDLTGIELIAGALHATGRLSLAGRAVTGTIHADTLPLPLPKANSPDPLPLGVLQDADVDVHLDAGEVLLGLAPSLKDLAADVSTRNGTLTVRNLRAKASGGVISGGIQVVTGNKPVVSVDGDAHGIALTGKLFGGALDVTSGVMQAHIDLSGEGYSPAALVATLKGSGRVDLSDATVSGFDLGAAQAALAHPESPQLVGALRAALRAGSTRFPTLSIPFEARGGVITLHGSGETPAGGATIEGTFDPSGASLDGLLTLRPGAGLPDVTARLSGQATAPTMTPELAGVARWLAERP